MSGRRMSKKIVPGRYRGWRQRSLTAPHIEPRLHPTSAGFIGVLTGFSFTKVQHTVHANIYTHLHNRFHVNRFVMHPEIRGEPARLSQAEHDGPEEFFLLQRSCQYKEAEKTGVEKCMQRSGVSGRLLKSTKLPPVPTVKLFPKLMNK